MVMMVFMSLYTMVDGVFVSRFAGTSALSAVNLVYPIISIVIAVGIMLATGGSAIIARKMGLGKMSEARKNFTFLTLIGVAFGLLLELCTFVFLEPILHLLGGIGDVYQLCYDYAIILVAFIPASILMMLFQTLFVTAGKPTLGLISTLAGGFTNIILDYLFIVPMDMGIKGAALATGLGYCLPALIGFFYFSFHRKGLLYFERPTFDLQVLLETCSNGSSEMVTNLSTAITTFLFNILMMKYAGEDGVASITIVLYAQYLLTAIYMGYSTGTAPIFSFNYGSKNHIQLKKLFKISTYFILFCSIFTFILSLLFAEQIVLIFTGKNSAVYELSIYGFRLFAISFLFTGISIFASSLFTALSDGKVSASISFLRTFVFIILALLLLPSFLDIDGIWLAIPLAELLGVIVSILSLYRKKNIYQYA